MSGKRNCTDVEMLRSKEFSHSIKKGKALWKHLNYVQGKKKNKKNYPLKLILPFFKVNFTIVI